MNSSLDTEISNSVHGADLGPNGSENVNLANKIIFTPVFLIQMTTMILSNGILLMMIGRSFRSCTSLNIFLLSISIFNLLTVINYVSLVVYNVQGVTKFPVRLCNFMSIVRSSTTIGITLLHLFISHHRLKIALKPFAWQNTRKQAWLLGTIVWVIACAAALYESVLNLGNGKETPRNLQTCFFPGANRCTVRVSLYTQVLTLAGLSVVSGLTYYFYIRAAKELKDNELEKECRLRNSSLTKFGKRKLTTPERAVVSLCTIFTIHCITQFPLYVYSIAVHFIALKHQGGSIKGNGDGETDVMIDVSNTTSTPILLLLASISFITTCSPLVLACINRKFKEHIKSIVRYMYGSDDQEQEGFFQQITARFPIEESLPPIIQERSRTAPLEIFYTPGNRSKLYLKSNKKSNSDAAGHQTQTHLQVPNPLQTDRALNRSTPSLLQPGNTRPSRVSATSGIAGTPRISQVSTTSTSVGIAAVSAGLVMSAPGHRIMINNFFIPDANEEIMEELHALNFV